MVLVFLADGFEEIEALATVDILRRAGLEVVTAGVGETTITGAHGIRVIADAEDSHVCLDDLQAVILPGGMPGTTNLEMSAFVQKAIDNAAAQEGWICAICAAPSILGHKGLLQGRRAVCFPGFEQDCEGALLQEDAVVEDGRFITAKGAGAAMAFAYRIVERLVSAECADRLRESMQCR